MNLVDLRAALRAAATRFLGAHRKQLEKERLYGFVFEISAEGFDAHGAINTEESLARYATTYDDPKLATKAFRWGWAAHAEPVEEGGPLLPERGRVAVRGDEARAADLPHLPDLRHLGRLGGLLPYGLQARLERAGKVPRKTRFLLVGSGLSATSKRRFSLTHVLQLTTFEKSRSCSAKVARKSSQCSFLNGSGASAACSTMQST